MKYIKILLTGMLNPCITINYKITKHKEGRNKAGCDAHLKSKCGIIKACGWSEILQYVHVEAEQ